MKIKNKISKASFSLAVLIASQASFAGGTAADTTVKNSAILTYKIGNVTQAAIPSNVATFKVDNKVDLNVSGQTTGDIVYVSPSSTRINNTLSYKLTNTGNFAQRFKVSVSHLATGTSVTHPAPTGAKSDTFNAGELAGGLATPIAAEICQYTITPDGGTASSAEDIGTDGFVTLAIDQFATVNVNCSMPNQPAVKDGDSSIIDVLATAVTASGTTVVETGDIDGSDRKDMVDIVLADSNAGTTTDTSDRNGMHSDTQTFEIDAPLLSVIKSSEVIYDPLNGGTNPKRIPGAIVQYTITILNKSDSAASGVVVSDELTAVQDGEVAFLNTTPVAPEPALPAANGIANTGGGTSSYASDTVTVTGIAVPAGTGADPSDNPGEVTVTFQVKIL